MRAFSDITEETPFPPLDMAMRMPGEDANRPAGEELAPAVIEADFDESHTLDYVTAVRNCHQSTASEHPSEADHSPETWWADAA